MKVSTPRVLGVDAVDRQDPVALEHPHAWEPQGSWRLRAARVRARRNLAEKFGGFPLGEWEGRVGLGRAPEFPDRCCASRAHRLQKLLEPATPPHFLIFPRASPSLGEEETSSPPLQGFSWLEETRKKTRETKTYRTRSGISPAGWKNCGKAAGERRGRLGARGSGTGLQLPSAWLVVDADLAVEHVLRLGSGGVFRLKQHFLSTRAASLHR